MTQRLEVENYLGKFEVLIDRQGQVLDAEVALDSAVATLRLQQARNPSEDDGEIRVFGSDTPVAAYLFKSVAHFWEYHKPYDSFVPAAVLLAKSKQVDDRIVGTLERLISRGFEGNIGRRAFIEKLNKKVSIPHLLASAQLAKSDDIDGLGADAKKIVKEFLQDELGSKPLGIYSQDEELRRIFFADRLLQHETNKADLHALRSAVSSDEELFSFFIKCLELTNPLAKPHILEGGTVLFPPSKSPEVELVKKLYGNSPIPEGFDLIKELITRVRSGNIDLTPTDDEAWYAHQLHALSALLCPQRDSLEVGAKYQKALDELFAATLAATRETHVKQLEMGMAGAGMPVYTHSPQLRVSPLPDLYERMSKSYCVILARIIELLPSEVDRSVSTLGGLSLRRCIEQMIQLFDSAAAASRVDLGEVPFSEVQLALDTSDADLAVDARFMVPLYKDLQRNTIRIRAFIGYEATNIEFSYKKRPKVDLTQIGITEEPVTQESLTLMERLALRKNPERKIRRKVASFHSDVEATFYSQKTTTLFPISIEVDVRRLLNRKEFQELCDREGTQERIVSALREL